METKPRLLTKEEAKNLAPGDEHYTSYVGYPKWYDVIGALQFRLLCSLGLRENHKLFDFGCGSLRAGRLLIPYMNRGNYFGFDPNEWLIQDAILNEIGDDLIKIKQPIFEYDAACLSKSFKRSFDYILAHSIFTHTGEDKLRDSLQCFSDMTKNSGIIAATFFFEDKVNNDGRQYSGWIYPGCTHFNHDFILELFSEYGFYGALLPWFHPAGQKWYIASTDKSKIPSSKIIKQLKGTTLFSEFDMNSETSSNNSQASIWDRLLFHIGR